MNPPATNRLPASRRRPRSRWHGWLQARRREGGHSCAIQRKLAMKVESRDVCRPHAPRLGIGSTTTSGLVESPLSPRSHGVKGKVNGTSACWLRSPSFRPGYHCGDRRWNRACGSHGHRPRQSAAAVQQVGAGAEHRTLPITVFRSRRLHADVARDTRYAAPQTGLRSHIEPVSGMRKRKLENGRDRRWNRACGSTVTSLAKALPCSLGRAGAEHRAPSNKSVSKPQTACRRRP